MQERKIIQQSRSFKDLDRTLKKLIKNKKAKLAGSIFEYLTKLFLEVSPEYKTKLRKVYLLNEIPTAVKRKLKLPNTDEGIDLIAETFDNEYWAIQCKYRSDKTETLKVKGDLATFNNLAFTVCKNISHGLIAATVNRPPQKKQLLKVGYILLNEWLKLDRDNGELFDQIKAKAIGKILKPKKLSPRPHQKEAISKTISYFKSNERGKMIMPCGTGKSLTAFWIAEKMKPKSILVAVPSLALLQQTLKVWTREFLLNNIEPDWLCVCSDDTVKEEQDDFVTFSADLGIKVDTNPRVIRNFLRKKTKKLKIVFTTYQSGRATAIGSKGFKYDLGIMDEAHKTVGSGKKPMAYLLHQKNIKIKKRLFMTATERLFRGDSDEYMSMDDPRDYGNLIYELSFKEAINSKPPIISDYKIITFGITTPEIEKIAEDNKYLEVKKDLKDITARELATAIALRKAIKKLKIKNAISFHRSIKRAENFRKQQDLISKIYPTYGKLKTFHVRGDMPTSDRALEMLSFEEEKGLMTNARCLTEGVDLPAIDCVCFTDPKRSKVDIVQAAGRALRLAKGKKFGYILIPIFIPDGMYFDEAAEAQGFDDVSVTVRALATTDKRIVEYLRSTSSGGTHRGGSPVDGLTSVNSLLKVEAKEFDKAIKLKVWDKVSRSNWGSFEEIKKIIKSKNLRSSNDYREFRKKNKNYLLFPGRPELVYKSEGWKSWYDFLGGGYVSTSKRLFKSYKENQDFWINKRISSRREFFNFLKKYQLPEGISKSPSAVFKNEWKGWGSFLKTGRLSNSEIKFKNFKETQKIIEENNIKSHRDYMKFARNYPKLNLRKSLKYFKEFKDSKTFFDKDFLPLKKLQQIAKENNINNLVKWQRFARSRAQLPVNLLPYCKKNGLKKIKYFFHNYQRKDKKNYYSFDVAKKKVKQLKFNNRQDFQNYYKKIKDPLMPMWPNSTYKNLGWVSWSSFLNNNTISTKLKKFISFEEAKKLLRKLKIKSYEDYFKVYSKYNLPRSPVNVYKKKYKGWNDFVGTGSFYNYDQAKKILSKFKLRNMWEYQKLLSQNDNLRERLPKTPGGVYLKTGEWKGWPDFLNKEGFYNIQEAKNIVQKFNFSSAFKMEKEFDFQKFPKMPKNPKGYYKLRSVWKGWPDFLGKKIN